MLVRAPSLSPTMSKYLVDRVLATPNIRVINHVECVAAKGSNHLEQVTIHHSDSGADETLDIAAVFIFIGVSPRTEQFVGTVAMDDKGFILTGADVPRGGGRWTLPRDPLMFETSIPGVFAAGDVRANANRRIAAAVGEGSAAIYSVHRYLQTV
jgi:thioredoxin reductase (NADPH)